MSRVILLLCLLPTALGAQTRLTYTQNQVDSLVAGAYAIYSADLNRADTIFRAAAESATTNGWDAQEAGARKVLGIVTYLRGDYEAALPEYQRALRLYEGLGDGAGAGATMIEMGNFFTKRQEFDRATDLLTRGGGLVLSAGDSVGYSNSLDNRGMIAFRQNDLNRADSLFAAVRTLRLGIGDTVGLSYAYDHLATVAGQRGRTRLALRYLDTCIQIREQLGDRQGIAIAVNNQGENLLLAADTAAAIPYLERSMAMSAAVGFTDLQQYTLNLLSAAYASTGRLADALRVQRRSQSIKDSLYTLETTAQIAEMQERYDAEGRDRTIALERARLSQRTAYLVAAAALAASLGIALLWYASRQRARHRLAQEQARQRLRDDRLRISRDLHDHLGAELSILASDLGRLNREVGGERLTGATAQVRTAMDQMRETIWAVRSDEGTWAEVFAHLRTFGSRLGHTGITYQLDPDLAARPLGPYRMLNLYRFCQEALRNAVRHAGARSIVVLAKADTLSVQDDGCGLPPGAERTGFGLASLRERAAELDGELYLEAVPTGGTRVRLVLNDLAAVDTLEARGAFAKTRPAALA